MRPKRNHQHSVFADYFIFPKYQRKAFIILVTLCVLVIFCPLIYLYFHQAEHAAATRVIISAEKRLKARVLAEKKAEEHLDFAQLQSSAATPTNIQLFYFDPNKANSEDWQKLGVREKTIQTIQNYLAKGGKFRKPEDLKKIYGLNSGDAERLIPYVRIEKDAHQQNGYLRETAASSKMERNDAFRSIEINSADTTAFIALPGIGSKLAGRIVNYRDKLGGFYSVDQLGETYGLPDSTFQKLKTRLTVDPRLIRKIKLNTASIEELKTPLIKYNVANAIIQYRQKNGPIHSMETLRNIPIIDDFLYNRIIYYLDLE